MVWCPAMGLSLIFRLIRRFIHLWRFLNVFKNVDWLVCKAKVDGRLLTLFKLPPWSPKWQENVVVSQNAWLEAISLVPSWLWNEEISKHISILNVEKECSVSLNICILYFTDSDGVSGYCRDGSRPVGICYSRRDCPRGGYRYTCEQQYDGYQRRGRCCPVGIYPL